MLNCTFFLFVSFFIYCSVESDLGDGGSELDIL